MRDRLASHNERVKIFANFVNAVALGLIGFAVLRPATDQPMSLTAMSYWWGLGGLALHGASHYILGYLRKEARA
ncbi:hypothetical protein [Frigidibacter sp. MR17.24]|uniref:hypothetical protein n=1 Tax=Frigidibacter sp. MR17.24 TaxID=3127345 RepID=UPI003013044E